MWTPYLQVPPSPHTIGVLLETILKNTNLLFMNKHFLPLVCIAMGTKAAPTYANHFMGCHKETIWEVSIWAIPFWKRMRDDIFLIFLGTTKNSNSWRISWTTSTHDQIHFWTPHLGDILLRQKDPRRSRPQTFNKPVQKTHWLCHTSTLPFQSLS